MDSVNLTIRSPLLAVRGESDPALFDRPCSLATHTTTDSGCCRPILSEVMRRHPFSKLVLQKKYREERGQFCLGFHPFAIIQQKGPKVDDFCRNRINLNPGMEAKEWGQGNECQNLAGRITLTHRVTRPEFVTSASPFLCPIPLSSISVFKLIPSLLISERSYHFILALLCVELGSGPTGLAQQQCRRAFLLVRAQPPVDGGAAQSQRTHDFAGPLAVLDHPPHRNHAEYLSVWVANPDADRRH